MRSSSASASTTRSNSAQVQALVGAVGTGVGVLDAGDQHAGLGERLEELRDERDRAADAHVDRAGAVPGLGERVARGVVRRAGGVDLGGLAGVDDGEGELGAPGDVLLEVGAQAARPRSRWCRRARSAARSWPRAAGTRVLLAPSTLGASRPVMRQRRLGPEPLDGRAGADPLDAGRPRRTRRAAAPRGSRRRRPGRRAARRPRRCPGRRAGWRSAGLRVISASGTRPPHMPECTAWVSVRTSMSTRTRPRRLVVSAGTPMSQLPESAITMTSARELGRGARCSSAGEGVRADLLLALDEHGDADRQVVAEAPAARPGGRRCRPCRRRRRGRRAGRRARSARTAGSPSRRGRSRAGRRGGRRAARSAHPSGPALWAITAGAPPSALTIRASKPSAREQRRRTASALRCTSPARAGSALTDSIRTRSSRSADPGQHVGDLGAQLDRTHAGVPRRTLRAPGAPR